MAFNSGQTTRQIMAAFKARIQAVTALTAPVVVSAWTYSDDLEDAAVGSNPLTRPNWTAYGAATDRYRVSTNKGIYNDAVFRSDGYLAYGPVMNDEFGFEVEVDLNQSANPGNGDNTFEGTRHCVNLFTQDAANPGLRALGQGAYNLPSGSWDSPIPNNPASVKTTLHYHRGELRVRHANGEWNGGIRYAYPNDRFNVAGVSGFEDASKRQGRVSYLHNTWRYDLINGIKLRPLRVVITNQTYFCSRTVAGGTTGRISLSGHYKGTPTRWSYRLIRKPGTTTVAKDWADCSDVVASNGDFSLKCAIPFGELCEIELAMTDSEGVVSSTFSYRVMCGYFIIIDGQSNSTGRNSRSTAAENQSTRSAKAASNPVPEYPNLPATEFAGFGSTKLGYGVCTIETARIVAEQTGIPCLAVATGIPGSGLEFILGDAFDGTYLATRNRVDGIVDGVIWDQGEGDADGTFPPNYYFDKLDAGYQRMKSVSDNPNLPFWMSPVGRYAKSGTTGNSGNPYTQIDAYRRIVKLANEALIAKYPGRVMYSDFKLGTEHIDDYHYTSVGYDEISRRAGWSIAKYFGADVHDGRGPIPNALTRNGAVLRLAMDLNGATGLTDLISKSTRTNDETGTVPLSGGLYGYQVSKDDFATLLPISTIVRSGNELVITLAADPGTEVKIRSFHGASYDDRQLFWGIMPIGENIPVAPIVNYITSSAPVTAATLSFTESDQQFYARESLTGGAPNKGTTSVIMPTITLSKASSVWARRRHPTTNVIQQAAWKVADGVVSGNNFAVTGVEASALESVIDLSPTGTGNWTAGTQVFAVGDVGEVWGQSLATNQISMIQDTGGHSETIHPAARVYAAEENNPAAWGRPVQTAATRFNSAGLARYTNRMIAALGVGFCVIGAPLGGSPVQSSTSSGVLASRRRACLKKLKITRYSYGFIGHTNSAYGTPGKAFRGALANAFNLTAANSAVGAAGLNIALSTIPNITNGWGTTTTQNVIRRAGYEYVAADAKGFNGKTYVYQTNLALIDGIHQNQAGAIQVGDALADAQLSGTSIINGADGLAPSSLTATTSGSPTFTAAGKYLPAALNGGWAITAEDGGQEGGATMPNGGVFCYAMWVKFTDLSGSLNCVGEFAGGNARIFLQNGKWIVENVNLPNITSAAGPVVNQWHYISFDVELPPYTSADELGKVTMYMDGVKLSEGMQTASTTTSLRDASGGSSGIRAIAANGGGGFPASNSIISEVAIYTKPKGSYVPSGAVDLNAADLYKLHTMNGTVSAVGPTANTNPIKIAFAGSSTPHFALEGYGESSTGNEQVRIMPEGSNSFIRLDKGTMGKELGAKLLASTGRGVDFLPYGGGGSTLADWEGNASNIITRLTNAIKAVGGVDAVYIQVGYNGITATNPPSAAAHLALWRSLLSKIRTAANQPNLMFFIGLTQDREPEFDTTFGYVRQAEMTLINTDSNVRFGVNNTDLATGDGVHLSVASYSTSANRLFAQMNAFFKGTAQIRGPRITAVNAVTQTTADVTIQHGTGSDFTPTTGILGFSAYDVNGSRVGKDVTAVRQSATTIRLTYPADTAQITFANTSLGRMLDDTAYPRDNSTYALPIEPTASQFLVSGQTMAPVTISGDPAPLTSGQAYSFVPVTTAGNGSNTFSLAQTLPSGFVFTAATGSITAALGNTIPAGSYPISITVSSGGTSATLNKTIVVSAAPAASTATGKRALIDHATDTSVAPASYNVRRANALGVNLALNSPTGSALGWIEGPFSGAPNYNDTGSVTGNDSGPHPDTVMRSFLWTPTSSTVVYSGLDNSKSYDFKFFSSRDAADRATFFEIGGTRKNVISSFNKTELVVFEKVKPVNGSVTLTWGAGILANGTTAALGLLNAAEIIEYQESAARAAFFQDPFFDRSSNFWSDAS